MIKKSLFLPVFFFLVNVVLAGPVEDMIKGSGCKKDYPGANVLVIFDSTTVDVQESGLSYVNSHKLYKVLTSKGALNLNVIKYYYDPQSAYVDIKKVVIYRKGGGVEELNVDQVLDYPQPARGIYWGAREKMIGIGRLEPGDAVEVFLFRKGFTYALLQGEDEKYIPPMRGHYYDIVEFWSSNPVIEKFYRVKLPQNKLVQYEFYNGEIQSSVVLENGKLIYTFIKRDMMPMKRKPGMVALSDVAPKLLISTSPDWFAKSIWFYNVNEDYGSFEFTPEIKSKVDEILAGARNEMDSISRLTHWVADEIRYSGISMGPGEGFTLHKGDMTFTDRCGVCKDKAGMLVTMLRAAGFESYAAMTMAGSRIDYIPADQFNHSVTVVKLSSGEYRLLDPTWVPFVRELWSSAEQQQNYLMGLPEGADLKITPLSPPEKHFIRIYGNAELASDGSLTGELTVMAEGQSDAALRRMFTSSYKNLWENNIERAIRAVHPSVRITETNYTDPYQYQTGPIKLKIKYEISDYAIVTEKEIIIHTFIGSGIFKRGMSHLYQNTSLEEREYPFRDRCSRFVKFNESIKLPGDYDLIYAPAYETFQDETAGVEGEFSLSLSGKTLRMIQVIIFKKRVYEADEWPSYRKAVMAQKSFMEEPVILKVKGTK